MISRIQSSNTTFNGARVNVLATADNHGNIMRLPRLLKTVENNAKEIFPKSESSSTLNFLQLLEIGSLTRLKRIYYSSGVVKW